MLPLLPKSLLLQLNLLLLLLELLELLYLLLLDLELEEEGILKGGEGIPFPPPTG